MSRPNPEPREIVVQLRWLGLRLWQRQDFFGFTEDSLALAEFVGKQPECQHICDLGSGSGGLLLLVWAKNQRAICQGLEIIPENVALAERSKQLNAALPGLLANCRFRPGFILRRNPLICWLAIRPISRWAPGASAHTTSAPPLAPNVSARWQNFYPAPTGCCARPANWRWFCRSAAKRNCTGCWRPTTSR